MNRETWADDIHLIEIQQRKPLINWWALLGLGMMIASGSLIVYGFAKMLDAL